MSERRVPNGTAIRRSLAMLRPHARGQRGLAAAGLGAMLLDIAMRLLEPWPVKFVLDAVVPSTGAATTTAPATGPATDPVRILLLAAAATVVIVALRAAGSYFATVSFALAGSRITSRLRAGVFAHVLTLSTRFHERTRAGDLLVRLTGDVQRLQEVAVTAGLPLVGNTLAFVGMTVVMAILDPLLALVVLVILPLFLVGGQRASRSITAASRSQRTDEGALAGVAGEAIGAIRVVQAYGLEDRLHDRFAARNNTSVRTGVKARRLAAGLERRTDVLVGLATAMVLLVGGRGVLAGSLTPGELVVFLTYLKSAVKPLRDLAKQTGRIARAAASGERVADLLAEQPHVRDHSHARPLTRVHGRLDITGLAIEHEPGLPVLRGAELTVRPGDRVALVGPSGAGKSTLFDALLRHLVPVAGSIRIDGHDLADVTIASVREHLAVVPQDSVLFAMSIADNIALARPGATADDVRAAARAAHADDFVMGLPDGYDTVVGERGSTVSGGERQRIAIARAILRDAPIVLLDEPTTGLDAASKAAVLAGLDALVRNRTTLVATHDPDVIAACDRVVEVVDGRLVERLATRAAFPVGAGHAC